jgi:hypothetical protein
MVATSPAAKLDIRCVRNVSSKSFLSKYCLKWSYVDNSAAFMIAARCIVGIQPRHRPLRPSDLVHLSEFSRKILDEI